MIQIRVWTGVQSVRTLCHFPKPSMAKVPRLYKWVRFSLIFTSDVVSTKVAFVDDANISSPLLSRIPIDVPHYSLHSSFCFSSTFSDSSSFPLSYQGQPASVVLSSTWEPRFPSNSESLLGHSVSHRLGAALDKQHGLQKIPLWVLHWSLPVMCPSQEYSIYSQIGHKEGQ